MHISKNEEDDSYFKELKIKVEEIYKIANKVKKNGFDPSDRCEIYLATNLAERVEGLLVEYGIVNISRRIQELLKEHDKEVVALKIAEEIIYGKYGDFDIEKSAEIALRTALAIL
ncbi:MAG: hypothetical protein QXY79_03810, partial [Candidatus Methanomethylicia archaeon]